MKQCIKCSENKNEHDFPLRYDKNYPKERKNICKKCNNKLLEKYRNDKYRKRKQLRETVKKSLAPAGLMHLVPKELFDLKLLQLETKRFLKNYKEN